MNLEQLIKERKTGSFYVYDLGTVKSRLERLKGSFPGVEFLYSVKCNPNREVLKTVFSCGLGADAASLNEVKMANAEGLGREKIYYSAPGKTVEDISGALPYATVIADSLSEVERIAAIPGDGIREIGLRINPDYSYGGGKGHASKFGVDEETALEYLRGSVPANIIITGIHVHIKSQELDADKLKGYYGYLFSMAERVEEALGRKLDYINLGSGIGVAFSPEEKEVDVEYLGSETGKLLSEFRKTHGDTAVIIETGRYAVCEAGTYVTHVADKKVSCGKTYVILQNTLNGFVRPSLSMMVGKYTDDENPTSWEPLFYRKDAYAITAPYPEREKETVTVTGNLCTGVDVIAEDIELPVLEAGDIVMINNAGAYAAVMTPMQFASQPAPGEICI